LKTVAPVEVVASPGVHFAEPVVHAEGESAHVESSKDVYVPEEDDGLQYVGIVIVSIYICPDSHLCVLCAHYRERLYKIPGQLLRHYPFRRLSHRSEARIDHFIDLKTRSANINTILLELDFE
jgi:hypothetical protein